MSTNDRRIEVEALLSASAKKLTPQRCPTRQPRQIIKADLSSCLQRVSSAVENKPQKIMPTYTIVVFKGMQYDVLAAVLG